jgi:hypothetical protein
MQTRALECGRLLLIHLLLRADPWPHRFSHAGLESVGSHRRVAPPIWTLPRLQRPSAGGIKLAALPKRIPATCSSSASCARRFFSSSPIIAHLVPQPSAFLMRFSLLFVTSSGSTSRPPPVPQGAFPYTPRVNGRVDGRGEQEGKSGGGGILDGLKHLMCGDGSTGEFPMALNPKPQDPESQSLLVQVQKISRVADMARPSSQGGMRKHRRPSPRPSLRCTPPPCITNHPRTRCRRVHHRLRKQHLSHPRHPRRLLRLLQARFCARASVLCSSSSPMGVLSRFARL